MSKGNKHYKFINSETDNVIFYFSVAADRSDLHEVLESTKHRLAVENGIFVDNIYYIEEADREASKQ
jgi:hypothetical protein